MDEQKEGKKDGCLGSSVTESTSGVSEVVVGESETLEEGQIEGSFGEEGEACNGEDIMVEVLGSDVFVDGVCANDVGDGAGGAKNLNDEADRGCGGSVEAGLVGNMKSLDGGGGVVDDLGAGGTEVSGGEDSNLRIGVGVGVERSLESVGSLEEQNPVDVVMEEAPVEAREERLAEKGVEEVVVEVREKGVEEVVVEVREEGLAENGVEEVGILDGQVQNTTVGTGDEGLLAVVGSAGGETQVIEEVEVVTTKVIEEVEVVTTQVIEEVEVVVREEVLDGGETQVVEEVEVVAREVLDGAERGSGTVGVGDGGNVIEEVQVLDSNTQNHVIDTGVGGSSAVEGSSGGDTQLVEEAAVESEEILKRGSAKESAEQGRESVGAGVDAVDDLKTQNVDDEGWNPGIETAVVCSSVDDENQSAQTQDVEEASRSMEELEEKVEAVGGSIENHTNVPVDPVSSCQPNQVIVQGEVAAMSDKVLSNSEKDEKLTLDKCLDNSGACHVAQVDSNAGQEMEVDKHVTEAEPVGFHGEQEIEVEEQQVKVETVNGNPEDHQNLTAETVCRSTDGDTQVTDRGEEVALMDNEVLGPAENDHEVKPEECSDNSSARDLAQTETNIGQQIKIVEPSNDVEQVVFHRGQEMEVEEQLVGVETGGESNECHGNVYTDSISLCQPTPVVDGGEVAAVDDNGLSNMAMQVPNSGDLEEMLYCSGDDGNLKAETVCRTAEISAQVADGGEMEIIEECLNENATCNFSKVEPHMEQAMEVDEQVTDAELVDFHGGQDIEVHEQVSDTEQVKVSERIVEEQVTDAELVDLHGGQDVEVQEQVSDTEQVKVSERIVEEQVTDAELVDLHGGQDVEVQEQVSDTAQAKISEERIVEEQVTDAELADLHGGLDVQVQEQVSDTEQEKISEERIVEEQIADAELVLHGGKVIEVQEQVSDTEQAKIGEERIVEEQVADAELVDLQGWQDIEVQEQVLDTAEQAKISKEKIVEGQVTDAELVDLHGGHGTEVEEQVSDTEQAKISEERIARREGLKPGNSVTLHQASYQLPQENEGEFSVSDLVWGKVRSHPWWPGQIFDPSDSSEKAIKYHKKDCFLVAYFGDRTFAWNDSSLLKPFRSHFSQIEKQSNLETFQNAVDCALEEVSRRVELGLACSCIPMDAYEKIKFQIVENTGIRQESSMREGVDESANANSFQPDKIVEYMKALAIYPSGGADRLELVIAKAQLIAFYRLKGYCQLPEFQLCGDLLENDADNLCSEDKMQLNEVYEHSTPICLDNEKVSSGQESLIAQNGSIHKQKHNLEGVHPAKKERSLSELMGETMDFPDAEYGSDGKATSKMVLSSSVKRKRAADSFADDSVMQDGRKSISLAKVTKIAPPIHKQSFKIGECIRRVASQLTGSPSILKSSPAGDVFDVSFEDSEDVENEMTIVPTEYSSLDYLLSQLYLAAQDPMKEQSFLNVIISFFSDFRNSIAIGQYSAMDKSGGKRKKPSIIGSPETFEFEDMNDTYWTDMIVQNGSEEQPSGRKRKGEYQIVPVVLEKSPQVNRRPYSRKRYSDENNEQAAGKPDWYLDERLRDSYPAELIMGFSEDRYIPSEVNLIKMFRRFGPLKELETEVDRATSRARVVFKRCTDAEVAYSSAGKFNIFGPTLVNYQLSYSPSGLYKASPVTATEGQEDAI